MSHEEGDRLPGWFVPFALLFVLVYVVSLYLNVAFYWTFLPVPAMTVPQIILLDLAAALANLGILIFLFTRPRGAREAV